MEPTDFSTAFVAFRSCFHNPSWNEFKLVKIKIRIGAEKEDSVQMNSTIWRQWVGILKISMAEWLDALEQMILLFRNRFEYRWRRKPFLEIAPWIITVFAEALIQKN